MIMDSFLDKTIYFSFDRTGFERHSKKFDEIGHEQLVGRRFLVTGGTSGIGESIVLELNKYKSETLFTGRKLRNKEIESNFVPLDLNDHEKVLNFAESLDSIDGIVLNAGGMPTEYGESYGYELQFSSQVLAHYLLVRRLIDLKKLNPSAHVIWMSSGGMYLAKFQKDLIRNSSSKYDKVAFYANSKRAQLIINDYLHQEFSNQGFKFSVMHPGWVDTSGVREAIPGFFNFTKNRLRSAYQGGDTAVWLLSNKDVASGEFWFDRRVQKKVVFPWTKNTEAERIDLVNTCETYYQSFCQNKKTD